MPRNPLLKGLRPVHPGEVLREDVLPALGRPKTEIARLLGISRQTLYDVLNEKQPITANLALRIGKLVGGRSRYLASYAAALRSRNRRTRAGEGIEIHSHPASGGMRPAGVRGRPRPFSSRIARVHGVWLSDPSYPHLVWGI